MNESLKKVAVIVVTSVIIFWIFKPKAEGEKGLFSSSPSRTPIRKPNLDEEGMQDPEVKTAYTALCAYIDAHNDGKDEASLEQIKKDFKSQLGIEIYEDSKGKLAAKDMNGEDILVNS
jgi:hypothetical protein